MSEFPEEL
jgi:hypothetical protein